MACSPARHCPAAPNQEHAAWRREMAGMQNGNIRTTEILHAICYQCRNRYASCDVDYPHQCLLAQCWSKPQRNWWCPTCSDGWWQPPTASLVTCKHKHMYLRLCEIMPRTCGGCPPSGQDIAEPNAPPENHLINARLGPAPLPLPRQFRKPLIRQLPMRKPSGRLPRSQIPLPHQKTKTSCATSPNNRKTLGIV